MNEQIHKFIETLKKNPNIPKFDETETKMGTILPILQYLGWDVWNIEEVKPEYPVEGKKAAEGGKVDYCLRIKGKSEVFLEAKRPEEDLEKHQEQLLDYSFRENVDLAILSNGILWWFYLPRKKGHWKDRKFYAIDISQQDTIEITEKFSQLLSREHVQTGEALKKAKSIDEQQDRQKKIVETLPKAWNKIISESDPRLVDLLLDTTESMCGFRPEMEDVKGMMTDFKDKVLLSLIPIKQGKVKFDSGRKIQPQIADIQKLRIRFNEGFIPKINAKTNLFSKVSPNTANFSVCATRSGLLFCYIILNNKSRIELQTLRKDIFDALYKFKVEIEKEIGFPLEWHRNDDNKYSFIKKWFDNGGLNSQESWPKLQDEMADAMLKIEKAMRPRYESMINYSVNS
jgi:predicted type IV restriction endonuclease